MIRLYPSDHAQRAVFEDTLIIADIRSVFEDTLIIADIRSGQCGEAAALLRCCARLARRTSRRDHEWLQHCSLA